MNRRIVAYAIATALAGAGAGAATFNLHASTSTSTSAVRTHESVTSDNAVAIQGDKNFVDNRTIVIHKEDKKTPKVAFETCPDVPSEEDIRKIFSKGACFFEGVTWTKDGTAQENRRKEEERCSAAVQHRQLRLTDERKACQDRNHALRLKALESVKD